MMNIGIDFDGTVLDSRKRHSVALLKASQSLEVLLPAKLVQNFVNEKAIGISGLEVLKKYNIENADKLYSMWISIIEDESMLAYDKLYRGVKEHLELVCENYNLYLVTARTYKKRALDQIHRFGLEKIFSDVFIIETKNNIFIGQSKSEKTKKCNIQCVIGDTEIDMKWAEFSGAEFRAVTCGFRNKSFWMTKCDSIYSDLIHAMEF